MIKAAQNLILGAKARAVISGRPNVMQEDITALVLPVLRHRVLPSYRAEAEGISVDDIVAKLVEKVANP